MTVHQNAHLQPTGWLLVYIVGSQMATSSTSLYSLQMTVVTEQDSTRLIMKVPITSLANEVMVSTSQYLD